MKPALEKVIECKYCGHALTLSEILDGEWESEYQEEYKKEWEKKFLQEERLKLAERDLQLESLKKQIAELKRKSEAATSQVTGEVLELEMESLLKKLFPFDHIEAIPKGVRGADLVHHVRSKNSVHAGKILWELKRTKNWSEAWIEKLKADQRAMGAECSVIVTQVMPSSVNGEKLTQREGVWVVDYSACKGLAIILREQLIQLQQMRSEQLVPETLDFLYQYLTGTQFRQRVEEMVESFQEMQSDLQREKRAMEKLWASREKQLQRLLKSTVRMMGDFQGIIGEKMPKIDLLEFSKDLWQ